MSSEESDIFETIEIETVPTEENSNNIDLSDNYILMLPVHEGVGGIRILQATELINDFTVEPSTVAINIGGETKLGLDDVVQTFISCSYEGCDSRFLSASQLKVHMRKHNGYEGGHECDYCKKKFSTGYALKAHRRTHTGEKPYTCPEASCQKRFKTSGDLQKHIRTHTGERPFKCGVCLKAFTTSNIRKVHMRVHTGEKPYQCTHDGCERRFSSATNFRNHLRIHTGEKPYICTVQNCQKRFTEYSSLYKHCTVHSEKKNFQCSMCSRQYRQLSTLNIHINTVHKDEVIFYQKTEVSKSTQDISPTYLRSKNNLVCGKERSNHLASHPRKVVIPKINPKRRKSKEILVDKPSIELPLKMQSGKLKDNETLLMSLNEPIDTESGLLCTPAISSPSQTRSSKGEKDTIVNDRRPSAASPAKNMKPLKSVSCGSEAILVLTVPPTATSEF